MVHFKIIIQFLLIYATIISCNSKGISKELNPDSNTKLKFEEYEKQFCFEKVYKFANKNPSKTTAYYKLDTTKVYEFMDKGENKPIADKFRDFVSYTTDSNFYLLQNEKQNTIIAIGKASGASAVGADYWNYLCYSVSEKKEIKFGSLINSPYSLFSANNTLNYVEVEDNIPRPASGEIIKLDYTPLLVTVYDLEKKQLLHIEMNCY